MGEFPTQRQEDYARRIARTLRIPLPEIRTKEAYSQFISKNVNAFKREQQRYDENYFNWENEFLNG